MEAPDFISSFHSLQGDLVGERKKNFYKLITKPSLFSNEQELHDALQKLQPKTYLESIFHIDALIYFKRTEQLKEILKSGNPIIATKILKQTWFCEEAFKNIEAEVLVNNFFPYLSYILRKKLLNRISKCWTEERMDQLFDALENRYGLTDAVEILHKCSFVKIKLVLEDNEIKLRPNQALQLYKKSQEIFKIYVTIYKQITKTNFFEVKVVNYIAIKDPKFLLELEKDEIIMVSKLGRRTTKNIIKKLKDEISTDVKRYVNILDKPALVRQFSPGFQTIYKKVFPDKFNDINCVSCNLIKHYPKKRRWDLFISIFNEKFPNKTLVDVLSVFDSSIKIIQPPQEILYQWAKMFYEKQEDNPNSYLKYYPTTIAIQIIKEKIDVTSDKRKRSLLVQIMLDACAENKDFTSLEEVLKYISVRHRNEDTNFRSEILTNIKQNFKLTELNETHWKYICEQIQILKIQKEYHFYFHTELISRHLEFLFINKKDHTEALNSYMKDLIEDNFYSLLELKNVAMEQKIYSEISKVFPNFVKKDSENYVWNISTLLSKIIAFSLKNKDHCIQLNNYPYLIDHITELFNKTENRHYSEIETIANVIIYNESFPQFVIPFENSKIPEMFLSICKEEKNAWWFAKVFETLVTQKKRSDLGSKLLECYLKNIVFFLEISERTVILWLFKNEPKTLVPYFETVLTCYISIKQYSPILDNKLLRQYSHFQFDQKTREYFTQQLGLIEKSEHYVINSLLESLAILLPTEEFINIIEEHYLPKKDKLDLEDKEMCDLYKIQCELAKILARVPEPYRMLPTIMKFARGDFLQCALPALYNAFYNSPQRILYSYVEQLSKQAVSVRKHAIFLSCAVLDKEHSINLLKTTNQSNVSSQKHLFSATLKYFLKLHSQDVFEKVIENMNTIDKNDTETLESLADVYIPTKYRHVYIEKCWNFYENLESKGVKINDYLEKLLGYMCEDILMSLSPEFVTYILNKYFSVQNKERLLSVNKFVVRVLINRKPELHENLKLVFKIFSQSKKQVVNEFFRSFLQIAHENNDNREFIKLFSDYWNTHFTIIQTLEEHIALKLLLIKLDNPDIKNYAHSVVDYMEQLISELSFLVYSVFKEQLVNCISYLELKDRLRFYLAVLQKKLDSNTCVLIIQILDHVKEDDVEDDEVNIFYKNIKDILENVNIPIVKAYCKSYFADN